MRNRTLVIAEAGINHNGDLATAKRMIEVAKSAGADIVKFQTAIPELVMTAWAGKAEYQKIAISDNETQLQMSKKFHFPLETFRELKAYCQAVGIEFLSTAFDLKSLEFLNVLGMSRHKIPSGEITNLPYLRAIAQSGKPTILSTGMATIPEIGNALKVLLSAGLEREMITILHCCTNYPTPMNEVNLRAMGAIAQEFRVPVGYSDHTMGIEVPIAAVALGAKVLEKHFTLDRRLPGPDQAASLEPEELTQMVSAIRNVEAAIAGSGAKIPTPGELVNLPVARRSITASRAIRKGELLSEENLVAKRPGIGICPMRWEEVTGTCAIRDFQADELIEI